MNRTAPSAIASRRRHATRSLGRFPLGLALLLMAGLGLRIAVAAAEWPAAWNNWDTTAYLAQAQHGLFDNFFRPAGYPAFLALTHAIWPSVGFTVAVQHLLGLVTGALAYATARRAGLPAVLSLIPAAALVVNLDAVELEHVMLSESLYTPLLVAAVYCVVRAATGVNQLRWLLLAGAVAGALVWVRTAGAFILAVLVIAVAIGPFGVWRDRLRRAGAVAAVGAGIMLLYATANLAASGNFGLTRGGGWALYARVAHFADCRQFAPPAGSEALCESSDARTRNGPKFYMWIGGPARERFGEPPAGAEQVGAFARTVVLHQPLTYARVVLSDLWRFVNPDSGYNRAYFGNGPADLALDRRAPEVEQATERQVAQWYGREPLRVDQEALSTLTEVQQVLRFHGALVGISLALALAGLLAARGVQRWGIAVAGASALAVLAVPAATMVYNARYGVPAVSLIAFAGTLGGYSLAARIREMTRAGVGAGSTT